MRKLRAERGLWRRWLGMALGALSMTLVKTSACLAAPVPATPSGGQRAPADCAEASPAGTRPQGKAEASGTSREVVTLVTAGVGVAGLTTGIVYELLAHSKNQEAAQLCRAGSAGGSCTGVDEYERHSQLVSAGQSDRRIGFVALGVGGAALVTTAVLLLTGHAQAQADDAPAPALSVGLADGDWGATLSGRF